MKTFIFYGLLIFLPNFSIAQETPILTQEMIEKIKCNSDVNYVKKCIIIAQYQLKGESVEFEDNDQGAKTEHLIWLAAQTDVSRELSRAMKNMEETTGIKYIEELTESDFLKVYMVGKAAWSEFVRLRGIKG